MKLMQSECLYSLHALKVDDPDYFRKVMELSSVFPKKDANYFTSVHLNHVMSQCFDTKHGSPETAMKDVLDFTSATTNSVRDDDAIDVVFGSTVYSAAARFGSLVSISTPKRIISSYCRDPDIRTIIEKSLRLN
jgi:hypothetical protein